MSKKVLIVGTGLGGLSTGLRLASRGYQVTFVEKNSQAGGRLNQIKRDGFCFDLGPSFFSMPYEFEELVADCGISMPFEFVELDPLYTVTFRGSGKKFSLYKDLDKLSEQFDGIEPDFKMKFKTYLHTCEQIYNDTVDIAIKQNFDSIPAYLRALLRINPIHLPLLLKTFWGQVNRCFESEEAKQIVSLIAFFLGRTPFDTNAIYCLLSHIEFQHTGYFNVKGGMYTIVTTLIDELLKMGADFHFNTEIVAYNNRDNQLYSLTDQHGNNWKADIFVINADAAFFRSTVFHRQKYAPHKMARMNWTMGYLTFYVGLNTRLSQIEHHNYFLGDNYREYARDVMKNPDTLEKPYYYVNVVSKHNPGCAPEGCEALFFVCPVPNLLFKKDWSDKHEIVQSILADFCLRIHQDIRANIVFQKEFTPEDWKNQFNLYQGAGLGLSHSMMQIGAFRPKNYDEIFSNCFYTGASTIPGAGLPMAVISSKLAVERILNL